MGSAPHPLILVLYWEVGYYTEGGINFRLIVINK